LSFIFNVSIAGRRWLSLFGHIELKSIISVRMRIVNREQQRLSTRKLASAR
jgi:hypothetical protein